MQPEASVETTSLSSSEAWPLRVLRLTLGYLWALILALAGLAVWSLREAFLEILPDQAAGLVVATTGLCLAGAQFIFMMLVADALCPKAPALMVAFLKTFCGALFWMSIGWVVVIGVRLVV